MAHGTPFYERMAPLCHSLRWKEWAGYHAVCSYDTCHEREYFAFRHSAGVIDVTPLYKYEVYGKDAAAYLSRIMVKDIGSLKVGQVTYLCWCDDDGKVMDDGTVTRLDEDYFRLTAAQPSFYWFSQFLRGYQNVTLEESTDQIAALSIQGPNARNILKQVCDADLDTLRFFRSTKTKLTNKAEAIVTRTGYTGDLGFEVWVKNKDALLLWDALFKEGKPYGIEACGLDAMDLTRLEAGFIMNGVDYFSANHCIIESRKSSPYEISLGWTVQLDREPFMGQAALQKEKASGSQWQTVGIEMDWDELERECARYGLPPQLPSAPWRTSVPIYEAGGIQVGYATSGTWSPRLKKNIALATLQSPYAPIGKDLRMEHTIEFQRKNIKATVRKLPFLDLERKKSMVTAKTERAKTWQPPKAQSQTATMPSS